uniref:Myosin phosphatase Rho-interacting protein n=1 Tax=Latimeria chalumnae TaxID=7897 RepID=H3AIR9_LATCH
KLEQSQRELASLYDQNQLLQEQLKAALEREQSAREGYVLQTEVTTSQSSAWQRLHKLNQDLENELEAQHQRQELTSQQVQAFKQSYGEAKDVTRQQEAEIQNLQAKLSHAMSEVSVKEQMLVKLTSELKMEKQKFEEQMEERQYNENTLKSQLKDSEERLKTVEAFLLEKTQALRDLERQQALQRDHQKDIQRLQEKISDLTSQLAAIEQTQLLKEERFQKNNEILWENHEKEKQVLKQNVKEAEDKVRKLEDRLQNAEQQMEQLLKEKLTANLESSEIVHQFEEQIELKEASIQTLSIHMKELEDLKDQLDCRFQEMSHQLAEADIKVSNLQDRLRNEETDYYNLEHSYEKVSEEFQKTQKTLKEKEEELKETKKTYEKIIGKKDQDLNEALIKMSALGSSLEETENKLQAKEEQLNFLACTNDGSFKKEAAENHVTELEHKLHALQLCYEELQYEHHRMLTENETSEKSRRQHCGDSSQSLEELKSEVGSLELPPIGARPKAVQNETATSAAKRQRIRFSSIQCQKFVQSDGPDKTWASSTSSDTSQDRSLSEDSVSSDSPFQYLSSAGNDAEKYISIIHSLETKLYITEEKLKDVTVKLESQQGQNHNTLLDLHTQWAKTEFQLREQLRDSLSQVETLTTQLGAEKKEKWGMSKDVNSQLKDLQIKCNQAISCLESCKEKAQAVIRAKKETSEDHINMLSEIETNLVCTIQSLKQTGNSAEHQHIEKQIVCEQAGEADLSATKKQHEMSHEEHLKIFADKIAFEATVLHKMASSLQNANTDTLQSLAEVHQAAAIISNESNMGSDTTGSYADVLSKKLLLESEFCTKLEKLRKQLQSKENQLESEMDDPNVDYSQCFASTLANSILIKAELAFATQKIQDSFCQRLKQLEEDLHKAQAELKAKEHTLRKILKTYKTSELDEVIQELFAELEEKNDEAKGMNKIPDASQLELIPYKEHLDESLTSNSMEDNESTAVQEELIQQLKEQAKVLSHIAKDLHSSSPEDPQSIHHQLLEVSQILSYYSCMKNNETSSSVLMQEAIIQAQIVYISCKMRLEYDKELRISRDACRNMDVLCQEHAKNLTSVRQRYEDLLQKERHNYAEAMSSLEKENANLKAEACQQVSQLLLKQRNLEQIEERHKINMANLQSTHELEIEKLKKKMVMTEEVLREKMTEDQNKLNTIVQNMEAMKMKQGEQIQSLEDRFQLKINELQRIHEEEMESLHNHYTANIKTLQDTIESCKKEHTEPSSTVRDELECETFKAEKTELDSMTILRDRIQELETQMSVMKDELEHKHLDGDAFKLKEKYQKDFDNLKATCERGFTAMEETHQKVVEELQRQHQRELEKLREEKDRLLEEETAATIAAIEAMKNAHREEMERELEKTQRSQISSVNSDIEALRRQYLEELQSVQRELEVLSEQYSQKCLENAHLAQALEAERQALQQCQRENQELNAHNQELNNRLAAELTKLRMLLTGEAREEGAGSPLTQGKDVYELEVLLRVKESEIQYLKQEINSFKDELQTALRDKKYATDKYKDIYTELSIVKSKADCDIARLKEQLKKLTESLGEKSTDGTTVSGYDIMKSKSNPDFLKKDRPSISRQMRSLRSKSLKEGLTVQERMKLFEPTDSKKI